MKKFLLIIIPLIFIASVLLYWFFLRTSTTPISPRGEALSPVSFNTLGNSSSETTQNQDTASDSVGISQTPLNQTNSTLPRLRQLTATPIGGYMASTTASTTLVRFIDRGVGHVSEARADDLGISKITNTTIPRVYESFWNKNLTAAVLRYTKDSSGMVSNFYAEIKPFPITASSTPREIPAEIKGRFLSSSIQKVAVSPKGDKIFTWNVENGNGVGYISNFDETKKTKIIEAPLTELTIEWPTENTLFLNTNASALATGYAYTVDIKKPALKSALPQAQGLRAKMSTDGKKILYSWTSPRGIAMGIYTVGDSTNQEVVIHTIADKCVWSKIYPEMAYCAVPVELQRGIYPDDWYRGSISFSDQMWQLNAITGEVHLVANLLDEGNALIDAINLILDPKEDILYFTNKRDLTLWSLDIETK